MELRRLTGGFTLLSAKEVQPGVLVFRLRDQTPEATEVLGTLQVRPNSRPAAIANFSLRSVSRPARMPSRTLPHRADSAIAMGETGMPIILTIASAFVCRETPGLMRKSKSRGSLGFSLLM